MFAVTVPVTAVVVTTKLAEVAPAGIVTCGATVALGLSEERLIDTPPVAAGPDKVMVPAELVPPLTVDGDKEMLIRTGGIMVRTVLAVLLPNVPVIVALDVL